MDTLMDLTDGPFAKVPFFVLSNLMPHHHYQISYNDLDRVSSNDLQIRERMVAKRSSIRAIRVVTPFCPLKIRIFKLRL